MKLSKALLASAIGLAGLSLAACGGGDDTEAPKGSDRMNSDMVGDTVVGVAMADEQFSTLVAAVQAADLVETLNAEGPYTVFAPTNDAFADLPEGVVATLLEPENKGKLTEVLTYHVIAGEFESGDLAGQRLTQATVNGAEVSIDATGDSVMVDNATVIAADVEASNGVIHVIDAVILPEGFSLED